MQDTNRKVTSIDVTLKILHTVLFLMILLSKNTIIKHENFPSVYEFLHPVYHAVIVYIRI
jgi:hypothetical protein